ncbi:MAG: hypothetical protein HC904_13725 [Blastochloris sp.]|nr:hypothetical protein [Blastochloris sp.]
MNPDTFDTKTKLPLSAHLAAGWPLVLVAMGGAIGGACGGLAYALSAALFKKKGVNTQTYIYAILIGVAGIALYFGVIIGLAIAFPNLFNK